MRRAIAVGLLAALTGCATTPPWGYREAEQRYKAGSALHAYGAGFVVGGLMSAAAGGAMLIGSTQSDSLSVVPGAVTLGLGAAFLLTGGLLVGAGNDRFTPPPREWQAGRPPTPEEEDAAVWARARGTATSSATAPPHRRSGPVCCDDRGPLTSSSDDCVPCVRE